MSLFRIKYQVVLVSSSPEEELAFWEDGSPGNTQAQAMRDSEEGVDNSLLLVHGGLGSHKAMVVGMVEDLRD